ncbi:MAG TPA: Ig-like domain-containing protein, partial [Planctomycetota bacterium]|nr:Ig-like domain-containing protein [Planctomycetota bacterium]
MRGVGAAVMAALAIGSGALGAGAPMPEAGLPANGDEVSPDLSDPGLEGAIRIRIPVPPGRVRWLLRPRNQFDQTGPAVQLFDREFARVPADAAYRRRDRMLTVRPGLPLPPGQYTLTLDRSLLVRRRHLDDDGGIEDFRISFTVGPDLHAPVVRDSSPAANQSRVPPFTPVRVVFNESLDP